MTSPILRSLIDRLRVAAIAHGFTVEEQPTPVDHFSVPRDDYACVRLMRDGFGVNVDACDSQINGGGHYELSLWDCLNRSDQTTPCRSELAAVRLALADLAERAAQREALTKPTHVALALAQKPEIAATLSRDMTDTTTRILEVTDD